MTLHADVAVVVLAITLVAAGLALVPEHDPEEPGQLEAATLADAAGIVWDATDVRVSDPDGQFPGPVQDFYEPSIAIDPTNTDRMVAFAIDLSSQNPYPYPETWSTNHRYRTVDAGATWDDLGPMHYGPAAHEIDGGDPVVIFDDDGVAYFANLVASPESGRFIFIYRSHDAGLTWDDPAAAFTPLHDEATDTCTSVDKQWLSLGDEPGELLLTYTGLTYDCSLAEDPIGLGAGDVLAPTEIGIYLTRSTDGGLTWSPRAKVWDGYALGSIPRVAPDGAIHIPFFASVTLADVPCPSLLGLATSKPSPLKPMAAIVVASSRDGGDTWNHHVQGVCEPIVWSLFKPGTYTGGNFLPTVSIEPATGRVLVAYPTYQLLEDRFTIEVITSTDGGLSWTAPVDATPGPDDARLPSLVASDGIARLLYVATTLDGMADAYLTASTDGGVSWTVPTRLSTEQGDMNEGTDIGDYITLDVAGDRVVAIWTDARNTYPAEIWVRTGSVVG